MFLSRSLILLTGLLTVNKSCNAAPTSPWVFAMPLYKVRLHPHFLHPQTLSWNHLLPHAPPGSKCHCDRPETVYIQPNKQKNKCEKANALNSSASHGHEPKCHGSFLIHLCQKEGEARAQGFFADLQVSHHKAPFINLHRRQIHHKVTTKNKCVFFSVPLSTSKDFEGEQTLPVEPAPLALI